MVSRQFRVALPSASGHIALLSSLFGIGIALAAPGNLDPGFDEDGLWSLTGSSASNALSVVQQSDGQLVLAGTVAVDPFSFDFMVARLAADGTLDAAFGADGIATVDFGGTGEVAFAVIQQSDGKLVLAGTASTAGVLDDVSSDMALARFNADGSLDTTFGNAGLVTLDLDVFDYAFDVIQQANGKLVVAGATNSTNELVGTGRATFARFNANGSLDTSFGSGGSVSVDFGSELQSRAESLAQQADGMLVAVGTVRVSSLDSSDMGLMRLTADGVPDPLFDGDGMIAVDFDGNRDDGYAVAIQPNGAIVAAGVSSGHSALLRVNGDGSLDSTFGNGGKSVINLGGLSSRLRSIVVRADNSLAATGHRLNSESFANDMIVARFLSNGTLDWTYADEGVATADFGNGHVAPWSLGSALIQQADGKLVAAGRTAVGFSAARFDDGATFPGHIGLITTNRTVAEATATVVYTVRRTGGSDGSVSVHYATAAGQALSGSDFQHKSGTLSWDDGDTSNRSIRINLIDDAEVEGDEKFSLTLSEPTGGATLAASEAVTNIANDDSADPAGIFAIESLAINTSESNTVAQVQISRGYHYEGQVSVTVTMSSGTATAGEDFIAEPVTVSWANRHGGVKLVAIPIIDDSIPESQEQFSLRLSDATGGAIIGPRATASVSIADNDTAALPTITVATSDANASEFVLDDCTGGVCSDNGTFTITRTGSTTANLTVFHSIGGTANPATSVDYNGHPGGSTLIPAGSSNAHITITPVDDATVEDPETVTLTITANAAYVVATPPQNTASITIADNDTDNDTLATLSVAATGANASEQGLGTATFTITRTGSSPAAPLTVLHSIGGTANPATSVDYNGHPGGSTLIPAGASTATITITPVDDATVEDPETVTLTITADAAYVAATPPQNTASITIDDNDAASSGGGGGGGRIGFVSFLLLGVARLLRAAGSRNDAN